MLNRTKFPKIKNKHHQKTIVTKASCPICFDYLSKDKTFPIKGCNHKICKDCTGRYIDAKLQENRPKVKCPIINCKYSIDPQTCQGIIPTQVLERWGSVLCELSIKSSQKVYCPFKDCSALLVNDGDVTITASECPYCHRLFCARCRVPWHGDESGCIKKLKDLDVMFFYLAKRKAWCRCNECGHVVERIMGCVHITCRCGHDFCYRCGKKWRHKHNHVCPQRITAQEHLSPQWVAARHNPPSQLATTAKRSPPMRPIESNGLLVLWDFAVFTLFVLLFIIFYPELKPQLNAASPS